MGKRYQAILDSPTMSFASRVTALKKFVSDNSTSPYAALAQKRLADLESQKPSPVGSNK